MMINEHDLTPCLLESMLSLKILKRYSLLWLALGLHLSFFFMLPLALAWFPPSFPILPQLLRPLAVFLTIFLSREPAYVQVSLAETNINVILFPGAALGESVSSCADK